MSACKTYERRETEKNLDARSMTEYKIIIIFIAIVVKAYRSLNISV